MALMNLFGHSRSDSVSPFDKIKHEDDEGSYWMSRELGESLNYKRWDSFSDVVHGVRKSLEIAGLDPDRFIRLATDKSASMREGPKRGPQSGKEDFRCTRRGAYLLAMAADKNKEEVILARLYFAERTVQAEEVETAWRKQELVLTGSWEARIMRQYRTHYMLVTRYVPGHWTVMMEAYPFLIETEQWLLLHELPTLASDLMDGSIGQRWANIREKVDGYRNSHRNPNAWVEVGPELRRTEVLLWENNLIPKFREWLHQGYFPKYLVNYLLNKDSLKRCHPIAVASAANHISLAYTGQPADLSNESRAILQQYEDWTATHGHKVITQTEAVSLQLPIPRIEA